jgi:hypothetical protein
MDMTPGLQPLAALISPASRNIRSKRWYPAAPPPQSPPRPPYPPSKAVPANAQALPAHLNRRAPPIHSTCRPSHVPKVKQTMYGTSTVLCIIVQGKRLASCVTRLVYVCADHHYHHHRDVHPTWREGQQHNPPDAGRRTRPLLRSPAVRPDKPAPVTGHTSQGADLVPHPTSTGRCPAALRKPLLPPLTLLPSHSHARRCCSPHALPARRSAVRASPRDVVFSSQPVANACRRLRPLTLRRPRGPYATACPAASRSTGAVAAAFVHRRCLGDTARLCRVAISSRGTCCRIPRGCGPSRTRDWS